MTANDETPAKIPDGTPVHGSKNIEIGIDDDGDGYIEYQTKRSGSYKFSVPSSEVQEFTEIQSENAPPAPTPPEGLADSVHVPDGWSGGNVEHTGGGIWCRIFRKSLENGHIEVVYNAKHRDGASAGAYGPDGEWLGEIDTLETPSGADGEEEFAIEAAQELMKRIDKDKYDSKIHSLFDD